VWSVIVIRNEQKAAFAELKRRTFEARVAALLRERFPQETESISQEDLKRQIREEAENAGRIGLESDETAQRFIEFTLLHGRDFVRDYEGTWVARTLRDPALAEADKVALLDAYPWPAPTGSRPSD